MRAQLLKLIARSKKQKAQQQQQQYSKPQTKHAIMARSVSGPVSGSPGSEAVQSPSTTAMSEHGRMGGASDDTSSVMSGVSGIHGRGGAVLELAETKSRMEQLMSANAQLNDDLR